jgi:hypothetical protein
MLLGLHLSRVLSFGIGHVLRTTFAETPAVIGEVVLGIIG